MKMPSFLKPSEDNKKHPRRVISYSLWGNNPKYVIGAMENAKQAPEYYPGWDTRFYIGKNTDSSIVNHLSRVGSHVDIRMMPDDEPSWSGMFWRFYPMDESDTIFISRDCDSRLSERESLAVHQWLDTDKTYHIMRDHPAHDIEILGGMWGAKPKDGRKPIKDLIDLWLQTKSKKDYWQVDQDFLKDVFWRRYNVANDSVAHDEFFSRFTHSIILPFPSQRVDHEFIGDVFDVANRRHPEYWKRVAEVILQGGKVR